MGERGEGGKGEIRGVDEGSLIAPTNVPGIHTVTGIMEAEGSDFTGLSFHPCHQHVHSL